MQGSRRNSGPIRILTYFPAYSISLFLPLPAILFFCVCYDLPFVSVISSVVFFLLSFLLLIFSVPLSASVLLCSSPYQLPR